VAGFKSELFGDPDHIHDFQFIAKIIEFLRLKLRYKQSFFALYLLGFKIDDHE
jgi:hypothetical protein